MISALVAIVVGLLGIAVIFVAVTALFVGISRSTVEQQKAFVLIAFTIVVAYFFGKTILLVLRTEGIL